MNFRQNQAVGPTFSLKRVIASPSRLRQCHYFRPSFMIESMMPRRPGPPCVFRIRNSSPHAFEHRYERLVPFRNAGSPVGL